MEDRMLPNHNEGIVVKMVEISTKLTQLAI